jgi:hypothetical protein
MSVLPDNEVIEIAKKVASANNVAYTDVVTSSSTDWTGVATVLIKLVLTPGSSTAITAANSALAVAQIVQKLADKGEERSPIVRYEEKGASRP